MEKEDKIKFLQNHLLKGLADIKAQYVAEIEERVDKAAITAAFYLNREKEEKVSVPDKTSLFSALWDVVKAFDDMHKAVEALRTDTVQTLATNIPLQPDTSNDFQRYWGMD